MLRHHPLGRPPPRFLAERIGVFEAESARTRTVYRVRIQRVSSSSMGRRSGESRRSMTLVQRAGIVERRIDVAALPALETRWAGQGPPCVPRSRPHGPVRSR